MKLALAIAIALLPLWGRSQAFTTMGVASLANANTSFAPTSENSLTNGLVAYWSLDDNNVWSDSSGNSHTLTEQGAVGGAVGIVTNAATFPGNAINYLDGGDADVFTALGHSMTFTAWLNPSVTNASQIFLSKDTGTTGTREYQIQWSATRNCFSMNLMTNGSTSTAIVQANAPTNGIVANYWYFCAATIDTTNKYISIRYGDTNSLLGTWNNSPTWNGFGPTGNGTNTTAAVQVGRGAGASPVNGMVDEAIVWNRRLTDVEITNVWTAQKGGLRGL